MESNNPDNYTPDNSPEMRFNNTHLELMRLPKGDVVEIDQKRRLHAQLVELANEVKPELREKAMQAAHDALKSSLQTEELLDEKYSVNNSSNK